jgi:hypothetical protein
MAELSRLVRVSMLSDYGRIQFAEFLGLEQWQLERALTAGLIPPADRPRGRWSAAVAGQAADRLADIRAAVGNIPDVGAVRAAEELTRRVGVHVTGDGVAELARRGLIPVIGHYKGWPVYDGCAVENFADTAVAAEATRAGRLRTAEDAAGYLRIRRSDFAHLIRSGMIRPAGWGHGPFDRRDTFSVPLYRTGDLDAVGARDDIDWAAVRAVTPGRRSPLAVLPDAGISASCPAAQS